MKITTKFKINDLVMYKYDASPDYRICALEINTVLTDTCNAGTQVFYTARPIQAEKETVNFVSEKRRNDWTVNHHV